VSKNATKFKIRHFEAADGPFCHRLRSEAFYRIFSLEMGHEAIEAGATPYSPEEFGKLIGALDSFVAETGSDPVGFCTIRYPDERTAEILYVYVDLVHLGEGIGSSLMAHAERWIRERHPEVTSIVLDTAVPGYNQRFYERLGYSVLGPTACRYPAAEVPAVRLHKRIMP
jgi:GNAT superfamily N-acetyltransferase